MTFVANIYYNIGSGFNYEEVKKNITDAYAKNDMNRLIIDLENQKVEINEMKRFKKIFAELGVEKLEATYIICKDKWKKNVINTFLKLIKTQRPVKFL